MRKLASSLLLAGVLFAGSALSAAGAKTYQVTGPVMDVQGDVVTVQKGKDLWQINVPAGTAVKKGDKVTITYTMTATKVEVKGGAAEKPAKAEKAAKPAKK
ncbi:MAG TPA: hypothetical protein VFM16_07370 [Holophagaceae bacterium]|nr:hypothetical protein [Holophagaceae bacterium]